MSGQQNPKQPQSAADRYRQRTHQQSADEQQLRPILRDPWAPAPSLSHQDVIRRPITGSANIQPASTMQHAFGDSGHTSQTGFNQPPGLPSLHIAGQSSSDSSNLSFFSESQLNPGVIQRPSASVQAGKKSTGATSVPQDNPSKMTYTQDLGLSNIGVPQGRHTTGSERQLLTGQSSESLTSTQSREGHFDEGTKKRHQMHPRFDTESRCSQRSTRYFDKNTMHSILLAIPSLGKGFEHILGSTPKVGNLINFFNQEGFMRVVPFDMPMVLPTDQPSAMSMQPGMHASCTSLTSTPSSTPSLTPSQREIFGMQEKTQWPLGSKKSIYESGETESVLDLEEEEEFLIRCLEKVQVAKHRRMEELRNKAELERACKRKKYFRDDNRCSDGSSGTTV